MWRKPLGWTEPLEDTRAKEETTVNRMVGSGKQQPKQDHEQVQKEQVQKYLLSSFWDKWHNGWEIIYHSKKLPLLRSRVCISLCTSLPFSLLSFYLLVILHLWQATVKHSILLCFQSIPQEHTILKVTWKVKEEEEKNDPYKTVLHHRQFLL